MKQTPTPKDAAILADAPEPVVDTATTLRLRFPFIATIAIQAVGSGDDVPRSGSGSPLPLLTEVLADARLLARFESKLALAGVSASDCWNWTAGKEEKGYGSFYLNGSHRNFAAHRLAFALARGMWAPANLMVLHSCDNSSCCNPAHLRLGTATENNRECVEKAHHGNQNVLPIALVEKPHNERGTDTWKRGTGKILTAGSRLSIDDVLAIRQAIAGMRPVGREVVQALASEYGVSRNVISGVVRGRTFAWVTPAHGTIAGCQQ